MQSVRYVLFVLLDYSSKPSALEPWGGQTGDPGDSVEVIRDISRRSY